MKLRHIILILLRKFDNEISSKTKIQKLLYFLNIILQENFGFRPHYYGPYSPYVENALDELIGAGFVKMNSEIFGFDVKGFETKRYDFVLTHSGIEFADKLIEENLIISEKIEEFSKKLNQIGDPNYFSLSIAAKIHFVLGREQKPMKLKQIVEEAKKLGWDINDSNINSASDILLKLNLIKAN